jgi:hypothetical protein
MARKKEAHERKIRAREHVIADLAVNYVERQTFLCGYSIERVARDYGIDLLLFTYNQAGEADEGHILIQVKGTEKTRQTPNQQAITFRSARSDLLRWLAEPMPLILVVYDAQQDAAWWLYVQQHFSALAGANLFQAGKTITAHIPIGQRLDQQAVRRFGEYRDHVLAQLPQDLHQ